MILQDETLLHLTEEDEHKSRPSSPPTRIVTVKQHFTVSDQNEMLLLAQKKFDKLRKKNRERASSARYGRNASRRRHSESQEDLKISQLLSSLLYLSLMMHRVDDMKKVLETSDNDLYNEWSTLFGTMHSPMFHLCERKMHNDRVKKIFNRKRRYRELYEEAKATMAAMETTSNNLSQALVKMSEENFKFQTLLGEKSGVEAELCAVSERVKCLQEKLQKEEVEASLAKSNCSALESNLKDLEIGKIKFIEEIHSLEETERKSAMKLSDSNAEKELKAIELQNIKQILVATQKDKEMFQKQLQNETESHKRILEEKEKHVHLLKDSEAKTQLSFEKYHIETKKNKVTYVAENQELRKSLLNANKEIDNVSVKFQSSEKALISVRSDLETNFHMLNQTLEANKVEQSNQKKLREMIVLKDKDITRLNESLRTAEIKFIKSDEEMKSNTLLHKEHEDQVRREVSDLNQQMNEKVEKMQQLAQDISHIRTSEERLTCEKTSLESLLSMQKNDYKHSEDRYKEIEKQLSQQVLSHEEYKELMSSKLNDISSESSSRLAENQRLADVLRMMQDSMDKYTQSVSETKESIEANANEANKQLIEIKLKLVEVEAENDILKASNASSTEALANFQANAISKDLEVSLLQRSVENLREEKSAISQELEAWKMKSALKTQMPTEMKVDPIQQQMPSNTADDFAIDIFIDREKDGNTISSSDNPKTLEITDSTNMSCEKYLAYSVVTDAMATAVDITIDKSKR